MAAETILQLPVGAALTGPEVSAFVQSGVTVKISATQIGTFIGSLGIGTGTVTNVSAVNTNGFSWSIATPSTTPALTLSCPVVGFVQSDGTSLSSATTVGTGSALVVATLRSGSGSTVVFNASPTLTDPVFLGSFTATGLVKNADLANSSMTIAGHTISLGNTQAITAADLSNGVTGSGTIVLATSPTLVTPILGAASATSITLGTVSSVTGALKLANSASANLTTIQAGNAVAARTYTWPTDFGAAGTVLTDAAGNGTLSWTAGGGTGSGTVTTVSVVTANGFAGSVATATTTPAITISTTITGILSGNGTAISAATVTGTGAVVEQTSPAIITPSISTPTITGHATIEGVTATGATGTGKFVFDTSPTLVTPVIGVATGTSLRLGAVSTTTGSLFLANSASANLLTVQAANNASAWTFKFPTSPGTNTFVLQTDGTGVTSWVTPAVGTGGGTVTSASVVTANGFAGSVATATTTPAITISTTVTGILSGNGTAISAATTTGSGSVVLATSPTLVTPNIGAATATTVNGATFPPTITLTGDVTGTGTGSFPTAIAANAVTNAKFRQSAALSVVGNATAVTANVTDISGTAGQVLTVNAAGNALVFGSLQPGGGGTGLTSMAAHAVLVGNGLNSAIMVGPGGLGTFFTGNGASADPSFTATPVLGINSSTYGTLSLANGGVSGAFVTLQNRGATVAYNFNLPTTAGTAGQVLTSGGGGTASNTWGSPGVTISGATVRGGYPTWSTTAGTIVDGQGRLNALGYGAFNDGTNAATTRTAIQAALNTGKRVYLPTGTYTVDATLTMSSNGAGLVGDGIDATTLQGNFASGDIIQVLDGVFFNEISNMGITRTSLGTSGSGINVVGSSTGNDGALLYNLDVNNHNIGLTLGRVTHGKFYNSISTANRSHGVVMTGTIMQWQLHDILSSGNGGDGFNINGTGGPVPCGQWRGLSTASNSGFSLNVVNADGLRVADSFFGGATLGEVIVKTATATDVPHHFTNVYCEANKDVNAWQVNSSCVTEVHLDNCTGTTGGAGNGIVSAAPLTMITNGAFIAKAGFGASTGSGINITGARGSIVGTSALGFGGTANIVAASITAISIHACRANSSINTTSTTTVSNVGNY